MKQIMVRKTGAVRLTSLAHPMYGSTCGGGGGSRGGIGGAPGTQIP